MDPETGLIYLQNRYYEPATAQYLTRDPVDAVTGSAYGYTGDNPLNGSDPSGLYCTRLAPGEIGPPSCPAGPPNLADPSEVATPGEAMTPCGSQSASSSQGDASEGLLNQANLGLGITGGGLGAASSWNDAWSSAAHVGDDELYSNAVWGTRFADGSLALGAVGTGLTIYSDLSQGRSAGYTAGDTGGGLGGAWGGAAVGASNRARVDGRRASVRSKQWAPTYYARASTFFGLI
jgi:uncharacterized protein RhaS with RHS repeats